MANAPSVRLRLRSWQDVPKAVRAQSEGHGRTSLPSNASSLVTRPQSAAGLPNAVFAESNITLSNNVKTNTNAIETLSDEVQGCNSAINSLSQSFTDAIKMLSSRSSVIQAQVEANGDAIKTLSSSHNAIETQVQDMLSELVAMRAHVERLPPEQPLQVDFTDVLRAIESVDTQVIAHVSETLAAIQKLTSNMDLAVNAQITNKTFVESNDAVRESMPERELATVQKDLFCEIQKLGLSLSDIASRLSSQDLAELSASIQKLHSKIDHTDVLDAIRASEDAGRIDPALEAIRKLESKMMSAIQKLDVNNCMQTPSRDFSDVTDISQAIHELEAKIDQNDIIEAMKNITVRVTSCSGTVLEAIANLESSVNQADVLHAIQQLDVRLSHNSKEGFQEASSSQFYTKISSDLDIVLNEMKTIGKETSIFAPAVSSLSESMQSIAKTTETQGANMMLVLHAIKEIDDKISNHEQIKSSLHIGQQTSSCGPAVNSLSESIQSIAKTTETQGANMVLVLQAIKEIDDKMANREHIESSLQNIVMAEKLDLVPLMEDFARMNGFCEGINTWLQTLHHNMETWGLEHLNHDLKGVTAWLERVYKMLDKHVTTIKESRTSSLTNGGKVLPDNLAVA